MVYSLEPVVLVMVQLSQLIILLLQKEAQLQLYLRIILISDCPMLGLSIMQIAMQILMSK